LEIVWSQVTACYCCYMSLSPELNGPVWWHDLQLFCWPFMVGVE
jgi:hypothetical protein